MKDSEKYYLDRFAAICIELNLDAKKVITNPHPIVSASIRQWMVGSIDDNEFIRVLKNFSIMNPLWQASARST